MQILIFPFHNIFNSIKIVKIIKIKFNANNPNILNLLLRFSALYINIINIKAIIKLIIDIHIIFYQPPFRKFYIMKKRNKYYGLLSP